MRAERALAVVVSESTSLERRAIKRVMNTGAEGERRAGCSSQHFSQKEEPIAEIIFDIVAYKYYNVARKVGANLNEKGRS